VKFQGVQRNCVPCEQRERCLRTPDKTKTRQVCFFRGKAAAEPESYTDIMARHRQSGGPCAIWTALCHGGAVFGNLRANKRLDRFTLRGQKKVDGQWKSAKTLLHEWSGDA